MEKDLAKADKTVLVEIVKIAQKQGLKGASGNWKDFLKCHDRKFGDSLSDPAKRSTDVLIAFLKTFTEEADLKYFLNIFRRYRNHLAIEKRMGDSPDDVSPQQRLVGLTIRHPQYMRRYSFPSYNKDWMVIPLGKVSKAMKSNAMVAIDCEMVLCQDGTEAVVQVCAVDHNLEVKLNMLVKQNVPVVNYRTDITGISSKDLEGITCSLVDAQRSLKKLVMHGTILVGHSLYNDLQALKIDHARVIDTTHIFKYADPMLNSPSLNSLCESVLGYEIRKEGEPHNCLEDARAAMKLVLAKLDQGFDDPISLARKHVPDTNLGKLLLHKIPVGVACKELLKLFSGKSGVDIQAELKISGRTYSTFAVFKDIPEADKAFKEADGQEHKDISGCPQKLVALQLSTGKTASFYIRKMAPDILLDDCKTSRKRLAEDDSDDSKRQKTCSCQCHVEEVQKLKEELRQRDRDISTLQKIMSDLKKTSGQCHVV